MNNEYLIISHPKAGRTWLECMLGNFLTHKYNYPKNYFQTISKMDLIKRKLLDFFIYKKRIRFSHASSNLIVKDNSLVKKYTDKNIIFLIRDPRDLLVSYFYQLKYRRNYWDGSLSEFIYSKYGIEKIIKYMNCILKEEKNYNKFLLISYEDLKKDSFVELEKFVKFLDLDIDKKSIKESISFCSFKKMKDRERNSNSEHYSLKAVDPSNNNTFKSRKGKVGSYIEELSREDINYIDSMINKHLSEKLNFYKYQTRFD